jgi:hypothetical protein
MATRNQTYAYNYFTGQLGWSPQFSNAMVASLSGESGQNLNTAILQGGDARFGGGNGIASWSASRFAALGSPQGLDAQLAAVGNEVNNYPNIANLTNSNANPSYLTNVITGGLQSGPGGSAGAGYLTPQIANGYDRWGNYSPVTGDYNGAPVSPTTPTDTLGNYSPPFTSGLPGAFGDPNGVGGGMPPDLSMKPQGLDIGAATGGLPKGIASVIPGANILGAGAAPDPAGGQTFDSSGPPVEITNISAEGQIGQKAIADQTKAVAEGETKAAQITAQQQQTSTLADLTGWTKFVNSIEQSTTNLFIRGGLVLLAVALLFGAWMLLGGSKTIEKAALLA